MHETQSESTGPRTGQLVEPFRLDSLDPEALSAKGLRFSGLGNGAGTFTLIEAKRFAVTGEGGGLRLRSTDPDPWLLLQCERQGSGTAVIWFEIADEAVSFEEPAVYLDFGGGFSEEQRHTPSIVGDIWYVVVIDVSGLCRVRLDPTEAALGSVCLRSAGIVVQPSVNARPWNDGLVYGRGLDLSSNWLLSAVPVKLEALCRLFVSASDADGLRFESTETDPHATFALAEQRTGSGLIWFEMDYSGAPGDLPSVYLDRGDGFTERERHPLSQDGQFWSVAVPQVSGLVRIRLDHTETVVCPLTIRRAGLTFQATKPMTDVAPPSGLDARFEVPAAKPPVSTYEAWHAAHEPSAGRLELQRRLVEAMPVHPTISVIVPVYKVDAAVMQALIDSVAAQSYPHWELCIALTYHADDQLTRCIRSAASAEPRIKLIEIENGGISRNSNALLDIASGQYIALLDHDDLISSDALFEMTRAAVADPDAVLLYSDKDMISEAGDVRQSPLFKPGWSPEIMFNANYLTHLNLMRRDRVVEIGGWDPETDGAQDWDLFLRVVGSGNRVVHVPKVLYHWRLVVTSVAAGGLAAKPYAAEAQLLAVRRHVRSVGWPEAEPVFRSPNLIEIRWSPSFTPRVALMIVGGTDEGMPDWTSYQAVASTTRVAGGAGLVDRLNAAIARSRAEIVVIIPFGLEPLCEDLVAQLALPLENAAIAACTGKTMGRRSEILDSGWVVADGQLKPLFRNFGRHSYSHIGSVDWYRNVAAISFSNLAFRKRDWEAVGRFRDAARPDIDLSLRLARTCGRLLYNPFAESWLSGADSVEELLGLPNAADGAGDATASFFSHHLTIPVPGIIDFALGSRSAPVHDYGGEARYVGLRYDFDGETIERSRLDVVRASAVPADRGSRRVAWLLPDFTMPFYGGIMTILRAADHMRRHHAVTPVFVGLGSPSVQSLRTAIDKAFPDLAQAAELHTLADGQDIAELHIGPLDASICTLWITAYPMLRMTDVRRKFYFMQDYEPLFYPAGTTSALAEATYRFGFTAICNTEPLAELYRQHGGRARHFLPAIDTSVFHPPARLARRGDGPVLLFSYARPGHPRNCFEVVAAGLRQAKQRLGSDIQILTAGADWRAQDYDLGGIVDHLGLLTYEETGELYRSCDLGLVAMATRHPSYLPFELMACGTVVLTNRSPYTSWLLRDGENALLFELSRTSIADTVVDAATNPHLRERLTARGSGDIARGYSNWAASCETIYDIIFGE